MGRPRVSLYCKVRASRAFFASAWRNVTRKLGAFASGFVADRLRQSHHAPLLVTFVFTAALCGCSASNVIGLYAADYRDTTANAGDSQLLLNILRARDNLPIHFYDLAIIHGSIQLTAGNTTNVPFANFTAPSAISSNVAPVVSAQSSPSFDVSTSDTQEFTRGMLSQIDPRVVKALFDQGVDPRIMMLLFFSRFTDPNGDVWLNTMACDPAYLGKRPELGCYEQAYHYLRIIDGLLAHANAVAGVRLPLRARLQANTYVALRPIGDPLSGPWTLKDNFGDLSKLDTTKVRMIRNRLYSVSGLRLAICYEGAERKLHSLIPAQYPDAACTQSEIIDRNPLIADNIGLSLRSTYDIIEFLGQVLRFQQETREPDRCLTLSAAPDERGCDTGEVLFQVNAPAGTPVVGTRYNDEWYALYDRHCNKNSKDRCDYSLQVLGIVELLLNENRQAKDIIATPRVQVVQ